MADTNDPTQNVTIWNNAKSKNVSTITDGATERLAVDASATIVDNESPTKYQLKTDYDATGVALNTSTDTLLYTFSGEGVIDLIAVNSTTSSAWLVDIFVDGTSRIRISMADLGTALGLTNSDFDIVAETANKQFRYHPSSVGFSTSFAVYARSVTATPTVRHFIAFRERT